MVTINGRLSLYFNFTQMVGGPDRMRSRAGPGPQVAGRWSKTLTSRAPRDIWRGLGGQTLKKCGKDAKQLDRSGPNLAHREWTWAKNK